MPAPDFETAIRDLRARDSRFSRDAYLFMFEGLDYTQRKLGRRQHVTGQELLIGLRTLARERFGYMAKTVLAEWGVRESTDFGHIVFNLVGANLMGKQDSDTIADFTGGFDFTEAFETSWTLDPPDLAADDDEEGEESGGAEAEGPTEPEAESEGEEKDA